MSTVALSEKAKDQGAGLSALAPAGAERMIERIERSRSRGS